MGLDITLHMPPGQFVEVEVGGETEVCHGSRTFDVGANDLNLLVVKHTDQTLGNATNEELREIAAQLGEVDPASIDQVSPAQFEEYVAILQAYAAAGGTVTYSS